ncbi:site-specific integrase, partial [Candidatus Pacearchaeota archaeon]|nr:site-specific integrase [Candidatus Pacearchaeota archaeon]
AAGRKTSLGFGEWSDRWLKTVVKVSPRTQADYEQIVRLHLASRFGHLRLSDIHPGDVDTLVSELEEELSPARVRKILIVLRMIFKQAEARGYITSNPASFTRPPRQEYREMSYLSWGETRKLLAVCDPIVAAAVLTGMRQGELLALRVGDVSDDSVMVRRTWHPKYGYDLPKNRQQRSVRIGAGLARILRIQCAGRDPDELVFPNGDGEPQEPTGMVRSKFLPALKEAGVRRVRFHDLRHTYASMMIALGVNIKFLQKQLGHKSIKVTYDTYGHLFPEVDEGIEGRLDDRLFGK